MTTTNIIDVNKNTVTFTRYEEDEEIVRARTDYVSNNRYFLRLYRRTGVPNKGRFECSWSVQEEKELFGDL